MMIQIIYDQKNNSTLGIYWQLFRVLDHFILRGGMAQWVTHLTHNVEVVGSNPIKGPSCFLEQKTLPLLLSTG